MKPFQPHATTLEHAKVHYDNQHVRKASSSELCTQSDCSSVNHSAPLTGMSCAGRTVHLLVTDVLNARLENCALSKKQLNGNENPSS